MRTQLTALLGATLVVLVFTGVATADKERIKLTPVGQAAAKTAVLTRPDLGTATGWTGGAKKPDLSSSLDCKSYNPKQSDLVLIGAAESVWQNTGIQFDSEAQVLETSGMVQLDWQRTVLSPKVLPCLRTGFVKELPTSEKLVSIGRVAFPNIAPNTRKYRFVVEVKKVRVMIDLVLVGSGQTEITLATTAPLADAEPVNAAEVRLTTALLSRAAKSSATIA